MDPLRDADPREIGGFRLEGRLGAGGMGEVFLGVSVAGQRVAVKVIHNRLLAHPTIRERFAGEVAALKRVYGSRVASLEKADPRAEPPWLAVEFVVGPTLDAHIGAKGTLSPELAAALGATVAEGLGTIHEEGLLHRDLKPHNIILGAGGPKLIDFGLAVLAERDQTLTDPGTPVGTPACMAPEQEKSEPLSAATDVHALGATLLFALTGHYPYRLRSQIGRPDIGPDLSGVQGDLKALLAAMLAFDPARRPGLGEVTDRLVAIATADGRTITEARAALAEATFSEAEFSEEGPQPERERIPSDAGLPTCLVPAPETAEQPQGNGTIRPAGWLSDRLRRTYARQPGL